jgi:hypothetical protein
VLIFLVLVDTDLLKAGPFQNRWKNVHNYELALLTKTASHLYDLDGQTALFVQTWANPIKLFTAVIYEFS